MRTHTNKPTTGALEWSSEGQKKQLLLVGSEEGFENVFIRHIFAGYGFRIEGKSTSLLDALARLDSGAIDLVILGREYGEVEVSLFGLDAQRRGFTGLILCVAPTRSELMASTPHQTSAHHAAPIDQAGLEWNELRGPISFTLKQLAVLTRVSEGLTNQQIAHDLKCSEGSVKAIIQQLFKKLGVKKRARLVRMAFEKAFMQIQDAQLSSVHAAGIQGSGTQAASGGNPTPPGVPETHLKTDARPPGIAKGTE